MIKMVSGECGGAMSHKLSLTAGCSASSISTTSTLLKVFRYVVYHWHNNYMEVCLEFCM